MGCKSIFVNLGGGGGGSVNTGVLQIAGGVALDSTLRFVEDQAGTDSPLQLSTTRASIVLPDCTQPFTFGKFTASINELNGIGFDSGTVYPFYNMQGFIAGANRYRLGTNGFVLGDTDAHTQNGFLSVKGTGANIVSFRDSSNVERGSFTNGGVFSAVTFVTSNEYQFGNGTRIRSTDANGRLLIGNSNLDNFDRLQLGGTTASFPSIKRSGINIEVRLADDTGYGGITAGRSTEKTLEVLEVSGAMGLGFFNTPAINQPTVAIGEATYISNGGGAIHIDDTIGGYTMQQVVQALQNLGLLA
jgi:hypothetical protein